MNDDQWQTVLLHLEEGWRGELSEDRERVYATFLKGLEFAEAMRALEVLACSGRPWLPTVPEVVAAVRGLRGPQQLAWVEAWAQIEECMQAGGVVAGTHPLVEAFVERVGLRRLRLMPFYDPDYGMLRVKELGEQFADFCRVWEARSVHGALPSAERGRLGA